MARRASKPAKSAKTTARIEPASPQTSEAADFKIVGEVLGELRLHLDVVASRRQELIEGSIDPDLSATAAALGKVIIAGAAERRNQRKAATRLTPDAVLAWFAELAPYEQKDFVRELEGLAGEGSLL